jgi:hypothetical protein
MPVFLKREKRGADKRRIFFEKWEADSPKIVKRGKLADAAYVMKRRELIHSRCRCEMRGADSLNIPRVSGTNGL